MPSVAEYIDAVAANAGEPDDLEQAVLAAPAGMPLAFAADHAAIVRALPAASRPAFLARVAAAITDCDFPRAWCGFAARVIGEALPVSHVDDVPTLMAIRAWLKDFAAGASPSPGVLTARQAELLASGNTPGRTSLHDLAAAHGVHACQIETAWLVGLRVWPASNVIADHFATACEEA